MQAINLEKLPAFAQQEVIDFYQFLLKKYEKQTKIDTTSKSQLVPRHVKPFTPINRDELYER